MVPVAVRLFPLTTVRLFLDATPYGPQGSVDLALPVMTVTISISNAWALPVQSVTVRVPRKLPHCLRRLGNVIPGYEI